MTDGFDARSARAYTFVDHIIEGLEQVVSSSHPIGVGPRHERLHDSYDTTRTNQGECTVDVYSRLLAERIVHWGRLSMTGWPMR